MAVFIALMGGLYGCSWPAPLPVPPEPLPLPEPARRMWPKAFFEVPQKVKRFGDVTPVALLGAREVLLWSPRAMLAYDRKTRRQRILTKAPRNELFGEVLSTVVEDTGIVWLQGDELPSALWWMPRAGGDARLVTTSFSRSGPVAGMAVDGGKVVWWEGDGTSHEVPLSGGEPRTSRHQGHVYISRWPWSHQGKDGVVNLVTGEKRDTQAVGYGYGVYCGPEWCVSAGGRSGDDEPEVVVQRLDGSDRRRVPGEIMRDGLFAGERYGIFDPSEAARDQSTIDPGWTSGIWGDAVVLYDRCTGKTGLLDAPEPPEPSEPEARDTPSPRYPNLIRDGGDASGILMYWEESGDRYTVFALPPPSAAKGMACP